MKNYMIRGMALEILNKYDKSIKNLQKALALTKNHPYKWKSFITATIADNHHKIGNDSIALEYYKEVLEDSLYTSIPKSAIITCTRIGILFTEFNKFNLAKKYFKRGIKTSKNTKFKNNLPALYGNLGFLYNKEGRRDSANYFFKKALQSFKKYKPIYKNAMLYKSFYKNYINVYEGDLQKGILGLDSIYKKIITYGHYTKDDKDLMLSVIRTLAIAFEKKEDNKLFINLLKQSNSFLTSFYKGQLKTNLVSLEVKYRSKEKESAIFLLEKEKETQKKIIKQQNLINYVFLALFILIILFVRNYWKQKKTQNKYELENLKSRLLRSQMNPHFLFNSLNAISGLVQKKSNNTIPYISKLANLLRLTLVNSREEFVSLNEELLMLESYLEIESNFSTFFNFFIDIEKRIDKDEILIPPMLIQPFVENAIVHGFKGVELKKNIYIKIKRTLKKGLLKCEINDNGLGFSNSLKKHTKHISLSGDIVNERLAILKRRFKVNARYEITSSIEKGTKVKLYIPYILDK